MQVIILTIPETYGGQKLDDISEAIVADVKEKHVTGLLYFEEGMETLDETENLVDTPLANLPDEMMRPDKKSLDDLLTKFRS